MEDLLAILNKVANLQNDLEKARKQHFEELDVLFFGTTEANAAVTASLNAPVKNGKGTSITPQQTKKRAKRLSSLAENESETNNDTREISLRQSVRVSNKQLLAAAADSEEAKATEEVNDALTLMPPPPALADTTISSGRPQRAAKLRSEKNLKEPPLNSKLRRPTVDETIRVKMEHEQRASQFARTSSERTVAETTTPVLTEDLPQTVNESLSVVSDANEEINATKGVRVKIKREKLSNAQDATPSDGTFKVPAPKELLARGENNESTLLSTSAASNMTSTSAPAKKGRKKKEAHRPIKIERFSDLDKNSPVSSRTRTGNRSSQESQPPQRSIYEDAIEHLPRAEATVVQAIGNETVTISNTTRLAGTPTSDATFNIQTANATISLSKENNMGDETFAVETKTAAGGQKQSLSSNKSMETAKDASLPQPHLDSLMTEDESLVNEPSAAISTKLPMIMSKSAKAIKMPARTHELFNPLLQSPVKMRVEAFENAANAHKMRPKRTKEQLGTPGSGTTPVIGKLPAPALGRFLTPTQSSSTAPINSAQPKKAPMSACKTTTLMKTATGTNLKTTNSSSTKTLTRENSNDDFRKGLHQLAEERKKQREQKHLQAAQQREARERERAERMAKLAKEREEKRIKKQQEQERKKLEMEEQQRKQRQLEEAELAKKAKAKAIQEQEREMLQQMKQQQLSGAKSKHMMMPPPPKSKYTFEMLHEDDSTDDEGKVSYKRPPPPSWSRSHVRGPALVMQSYCPTDVIDSFFSVAPTTPDLKMIFPNIDPRHLKRNSSVLWNTPPRYSELPKY